MDTPQPPPLWQSDVVLTPPPTFNNSSASLVSIPVETSEKVSEAWTHVKQVVANSGKEVDLYDLLAGVRRDDTYQPHVSTWPALLKPLSPVMADLPVMVQDKYRACQTMCFCGLFPEIGRAWASVDNSLFLWRYDRSNDVPTEYREQEQAICAVGLVKPKSGTFLEAMKYVLVVCTTVEITLVGVIPKSGDPSGGEIQFQTLPMYRVASDNVVMSCVASTATGQVFLGGSDGHLYELRYYDKSNWKHSLMQKVRITGGFQQLLPSFLPQILFGAPASLDHIVVDNERRVLYTLSSASVIQVFDLSPEGGGSVKKVADLTDLVEAASKSAMGRELFRPGDKKGADIRHLAVIPTSESSRLHLLAITADGRRVYMSTYHPHSLISQAASKARPAALSVIFTRAAPPHSAHSIPGRLGIADLGRSGNLEVVAALYHGRTLLLSEAVGSEVRSTKMVVTCPNSSVPASSLNTSFASNNAGLRETFAELDSQVPGEPCSIAAAPRKLLPGIASQLRMRDELATQIFAPPQRFVVITTAGVLEMERKRPVDVLQAVLEERNPDKLRAFFAHYGPPEAAGMCYLLAASPLSGSTPRLVEEARAALENTGLVGEPRMPEDPTGTADLAAHSNASGIYMGQAVNPNPEPEWSGAHRGLCLYASRLLQPVLEQPLVSVKTLEGGALLACSLDDRTLQELAQKLRALTSFLGEQQHRRQQQGLGQRHRGHRSTGMLLGGFLDDSQGDVLGGNPNKRQRLLNAVVTEDRRSAAVRVLVGRAAEALNLLRTLSQCNLGRLAESLSPAMKQRLKQMKVRELVVDSDGEELASALISACVGDALDSSSAAVQQLAASLQQHCPSYFKEHDRVWYQAMDTLKAAEKAQGAQRQDLTREAVAQLMQVPLACNLDYLTTQLTRLHYYEGLVELPLKAAAAMDPENKAERPQLGEECQAARNKRGSCYEHILQLLRPLVDPSQGGQAGGEANGMSVDDRRELKAALLRAAKGAQDRYFHSVLYGALIDWGAYQELLRSFDDSPFLEGYLREEVGLPRTFAGTPLGPLSKREVTQLRLLATLYAGQKRYQEASAVHWQLAMRRTEAGDREVTLADRAEHADQALIQAKASGAMDLIREREADRAALQFQLMAVEALQGSREGLDAEGQEEVDLQLDALRTSVVSVDYLYNNVAAPFKLWALALRLINFTGVGREEAEVVRTYWDWLLLEACLSRRGEGVTGAQLQDCCTKSIELGAEFYPNEDSFPSAHVVLRLEQIAAGLWPPNIVVEPTARTPQEASEAIVDSLLEITKGSTEAVQRIYDAVLSRRGLGRLEGEASAPRLRLQLLGSLLLLCQRSRAHLRDSPAPFGGIYRPFDTYSGWGGKAVGNLLAACDRCALEARHLGPDGEQLAAQFEAIRREVEARR